MYKRVAAYIEKNSMLEGIKNVIVGFSGGADSVCLLSLLKRYISDKNKFDNKSDNAGTANAIRLIAVHVHHGIRGEEANRDEAFCRKFCEDNGIEYRCYYYDIPTLATESGMSEEQQGRLCRYEAFAKVISESVEAAVNQNVQGASLGADYISKASAGCSVVAVAHHENDQAETMLHNLVRGTGLSGMTAMAPKMFRADIGCSVIRPLLCVKRSEIEEYLKKDGLNYCTDSTNLTNDYTRNKIRHNVIDYMTKEINSSAVDNICRFGERLRLFEEYIDIQVSRLMSRDVSFLDNGNIFILQELFGEHISITGECVYRILAGILGKDMEDVHVDSIVSLSSLQTGRRISLPKGYEARKKYEGVEIYIANNCDQTVDIIENAQPSDIKIISRDEFNVEFGEKMFNDIYTKYFDYDKIIKYASDFQKVADIEERHRRAGDYFVCDREGHRKKLKSYLVDEKVPEEQRDKLRLFAIDNHILWIVGMRDTAAFWVDEGTEKILKIQLRV